MNLLGNKADEGEITEGRISWAAHTDIVDP